MFITIENRTGYLAEMSDTLFSYEKKILLVSHRRSTMGIADEMTVFE